VDGAEAVRALAKAHFALVIMDCHMPVMDGYEATHCIRAGDATDTNRNIVIIAMTANALEGDREKCIASGMDDYISKPISLHGLCEVLTRNLPKP
jgi:CheY-like chemotaxis protein